jgi:DNA helicase-2/ATP-dependent DNA helicase PcrA
MDFTRNFSIYDTADQAKCVKAVMNELNLDTTNWRPSAVSASISNAKNELLSVEEFSKYKSGYYNDVVSKVYTSIRNILRQIMRWILMTCFSRLYIYLEISGGT